MASTENKSDGKVFDTVQLMSSSPDPSSQQDTTTSHAASPDREVTPDKDSVSDEKVLDGAEEAEEAIKVVEEFELSGNRAFLE